MAASDPPATMASAAPRRIRSNDSPMALAEEAQADTVQKFGPFKPNRMDTRPAAISEMNMGTKNGETRSGPSVM